MDKYTELARQSIKYFLSTHKIMGPPLSLPQEMLQQKAGVFVSLHQRDNGTLRGCIGTYLPTKKSLAEEIIANALAASFGDDRFNPLKAEEINNLEINVDVLSPLQEVKELSDLDPKKYGLLVKSDNGRSGLLLPDIGVETVNEQIEICCQKGGIDPKSHTLSLFRFTVNRHK